MPKTLGFLDRNNIAFQVFQRWNLLDEATKANMKKLLYENENRSEGSNIGCSSRFVATTPPIYRDSSLLCNKIYNTKVPDLQVEPIFDSYNGEGDPIAHIKDFKMKFELKFRVNENLMSKYFSTTFIGDALKWYFSLPIKAINCYAHLISEFYIHFKYHAPR